MEYNLAPLTGSEEKRLVEIYFFHVIHKLLRELDNTQRAIEIIESTAGLYEANGTVLSNLIQHILLDVSRLRPIKKEAVILFHRSGIPVRQNARFNHVHTNTVYSYLKDYMDEGQPELFKQSDQRQYDEIAKFMSQIQELVQVFNIGGWDWHGHRTEG